MNEKFLDFVRKYANQRVAVAVSGGVDSICMLHWLAKHKMNIVALHVHHHLREHIKGVFRSPIAVCIKAQIRIQHTDQGHIGKI